MNKREQLNKLSALLGIAVRQSDGKTLCSAWSTARFMSRKDCATLLGGYRPRGYTLLGKHIAGICINAGVALKHADDTNALYVYTQCTETALEMTPDEFKPVVLDWIHDAIKHGR